MGNALSFLPTWLGGRSVQTDPALQLEDDTDAGIEASHPHDAVAAGHRAWAKAFEDRNFTALAKLYSRDCKICPSGTRTAYGRQECALGWESLIATGVGRVSFLNTLLESSTEDMLSETSMYELFGLDNTTVIDTGKHMMLWRQINGKWFIHLHIFNSNKPAAKSILDTVSETCFMWEYSYFMRDFQSISNLYTLDCVLCPPAWPQTEGSLNVQRFWARFPSMGVDRIERAVLSVDAMGPSHIAAELSYTMYDYGNQIVDLGKTICIFKKTQDIRWCIHNEMFNSDARVPQVSTENEQKDKTPTIQQISSEA